MHIVAGAAALLLLLILLLPIVLQRFRVARRERAVHLDESCHWYANYDEGLRYEPSSGHDIVRLPREEVLRRGYQPSAEVQVVPRTFRNRVPGDVKIRLWKSDGSGTPPLWLCEWAMNPVRVAIGVGDREQVPGVESGRVPVEPTGAPEPPRAMAEGEGSEEAATAPPAVPEPAIEALPAALPEAAATDETAVEASTSGAVLTDAAAVADTDSTSAETTSPGHHGRSRRKRRRRR